MKLFAAIKILTMGLLIIIMLVANGCSQFFWTGNYWIIRIVDVETSSVVELLRSYSDLFSPRWSPVENIIAYYTSEKGGGLYRIDSDRTNNTRIISIETAKVPNSSSINIAWAPNGGRILCLIPSVKEFKIISKEGTEEASVDISTMETVSSPVWSSDNQRIAFVSGSKIYAVNVDGANLSQVTSGSLEVGSLDWVLAEGEMVFEARESGSETWEVYAINPDGTGQRKVIAGRKPKWSPDGQKIAFVSGEAFWTMNGNGQKVEFLDGSFSYDYYWSPDGSKIVYGQMYVIDIGLKKHKEIQYIGNDVNWSPDSKKIVTNYYVPD